MTTMATSQRPFHELLPYQKRNFVPEDARLTEVKEVRALYEKLINRPIGSSVELEQWLLDHSELESALDEQGTILYILMTCQTDDESRAKNYRDFIQNIIPAIKPLDDQLNHKYLKALIHFPLDKKQYEIYTRAVRSDVELFRQENVPLQTELDLLSQEYQKICGAMMVEFEGQERTMPQMNKFLLEPDRDLRELAWRKIAQRRLTDKDKLDELFTKMVSLRHQIAINAGFKNFRDYQFIALHRFDYTPDDCKQYHETIEKLVVPLWSKMLKTRCQQMDLKKLKPWDTAVDPLDRPPLKPFDRVDELIDGCKKIFNQVDGELGQQFADISSLGLLDLASRKGKAPGGYQSSLNEARQPFIFMNAVGLDSDVRTLLHEAGHAFHSLACRHQTLKSYRHGPMEFNEVASMSMELLAGEHLTTFYNLEDEKRSRREHLEDIIFILIWVATIDAFQHWIYENPEHSLEERKKWWLKIRNRFEVKEMDWIGLEQEHVYLWHRQLHIFEVPFYYIEYGIAQLGALQLWFKAQQNWPKAIADYRHALSLGGSCHLPELFKAAGIHFDFSDRVIAPLVRQIELELHKL